jgi:phosphatidylinositol 3-kinase
MPLDPSIKLGGLIASTVKVFASAVYPCVIEFTEYDENKKDMIEYTSDDVAIENEKFEKKTHKIFIKSGDDVRQDQLIMQMITLMDSLLKKVNLDLKILTYGILAVGQKDGIKLFY